MITTLNFLFACKVGYPKYILIDKGSQLVKGYDTMRLSLKDIENKLYQDVMVEFDVCPVAGHNFNRKVERRGRHIKKSLEEVLRTGDYLFYNGKHWRQNSQKQ